MSFYARNEQTGGGGNYSGRSSNNSSYSNGSSIELARSPLSSSSRASTMTSVRDTPERTELRKIIDQQRKELQSRTGMLERAKQAIENLRNDGMTTQETLVSIDALKNELTTIKLEKGLLQQQTRSLEAIVKSLRTDKENLFQQILGLKEQILNNSLQESHNTLDMKEEYKEITRRVEEENKKLKRTLVELQESGQERNNKVKEETRREMTEKISTLKLKVEQEITERSRNECTAEKLRVRIHELERKLRASEEAKYDLNEVVTRNQYEISKIKEKLDQKESQITRLAKERQSLVDSGALHKITSQLKDVCKEIRIQDIDQVVSAVKNLVILSKGANHWIRDSTEQPLLRRSDSEDSLSQDESIIVDILRLQMNQ